MTTELAPAATLLGSDEGEGVWFADSLLRYKVTGDETHGQLALAEVRAPRGSGSPVHTHRHEDEAWYILEGELTFWLGEESRRATTGDFIFGPRGLRHRFLVDSGVARFLILVTPAGFEDFTRACGWPATVETLPPPDLSPTQRRGTRRCSPTARHRHRFAVGASSPVQSAPRDRPWAKPCPMHQVPLTTIRNAKEHIMISTYKAAPDIDVLTTNFPIPGYGQLAINSFLLHGDVPVLVDTGPVVERESFMTALKSVIDPVDLRWIWLTHTDGDHIGALGQLLAEYPDIKVITTFLGVGIMSVSDPLPMDRIHLVNPGQSITLGSRTLTAFRPPTFDNPSTTGFFDDKLGRPLPGRLFRGAPAGRSSATLPNSPTVTCAGAGLLGDHRFALDARGRPREVGLRA